MNLKVKANCLHRNKTIKIDGKKVTQKGLKSRNTTVQIKNARMSLINCTFYIRSGVNREELVNYLNNSNTMK